MAVGPTAWPSTDDTTVDEDSALVRQAQAEPAAFAFLYRRYVDKVYWYMRARTMNPEDAHDLTQLVFLRALEAIPHYEHRGVPFAAWLFRIAHNSAISHRRRQRFTLPLSWIDRSIELVSDGNPEVESLRQDSLRQLRILVDGLDPKKRELLALRFAAGLSSREIGFVIGKSEAAVKKQITRTLRGLKDQYRD